MQIPYTFLVYTGLIGTLTLLAVEMSHRLRSFRKSLTVFWLTLLSLIWLLLPQTGRWLFSAWAPTTVLGGQMILDMTPVAWGLGLAVALSFCGAAWVELGSSRSPLPLSGLLLLLTLFVTWLALASGSLLTMLAAWAIFDLLWGVTGLLSGGDGERVTFGLVLHGIASLILWATALLLGRSGHSTLWWLMWMTPATLSLLMAAALMRIGVYPFHIIFHRRITALRPLVLASSIGSLLGLSLLYRVMQSPGFAALPGWVMALGAISLLWGGLMAWMAEGPRAMFWATYALLGGVVAGATAIRPGASVLTSLGVWIAGWVLLSVSRGRDTRAIGWSWPGWLVLLFLLGAPPSPLGWFYHSALVAATWPWRIVLVLGWALASATLLQAMRRPAVGAVSPPRPWLGVSLLVGLLFPLGGLLGSLNVFKPSFTVSWLGLSLWGVSMLLAAILVWLRPLSRHWLHQAEALFDIVDLQWLYRALWRGFEHLLGFVRVISDVVEGSGALLWSLLILLLILLVVANQ